MVILFLLEYIRYKKMKIIKRPKLINSRSNLLLIGILLLAFLFRFYNLQNFLHFGMDQEYEALVVKNIITGKHFPLIGVNASDTGLYLGPAFLYFAAIPFFLSGGNPIGWGMTASFIGVLTVYFVYRLGREMFSEKTGIFASLLYACSFLVSFYDRRFWNPSPIPLLSILIGFLLFKIINKDRKSLLILAVVFGFGIQAHLQLMILLPLIIWVVWKRKRMLSRRLIFYSLLLFFLLQMPYIFFELRHNFLNTQAAINLVLNRTKTYNQSTLLERNASFLSTLGRFFWIPFKPDLFLESGQCKELAYLRKNAYPEGILLVVVGIFIFFLRYRSKNKLTLSSKLILSIFLLTFLFVEFYQRSFFEYYLLFFFPWLAVALGRSLDYIWEKEHGEIIVIPTISLFIILNLITLFSAYSSYPYIDKMKAFRFIKKYVSHGNYRVEALGDCTRFGGYRYLSEYFVGKPAHSYMDSYFAWLYQDDPVDSKRTENLALFSMIDPRGNTEEIKRLEEQKIKILMENKLSDEKKFGNIQVFIFK